MVLNTTNASSKVNSNLHKALVEMLSQDRKANKMIRKLNNLVIVCDKCLDYLYHPDNCIVWSFRGDIVKEGSADNIKQVAIEYGWHIDDKNHLCNKCKSDNTSTNNGKF